LTILCSGPTAESLSMDHAAQAETTALRLADGLAGWLMSRQVYEDEAFPSESSLSYDDSRRLALQSLAWPLCTQVLKSAPAQASRVLCFLFFCAVRLPNLETVVGDTCISGAADLKWRTYMTSVFEAFLAGDFIHGSGVALAHCKSSLCDPARGAMQDYMRDQSSNSNDYDVSSLQRLSAKRLGQLLATVCFFCGLFRKAGCL